MMADVYNLPVRTSSSKEGPALGAAILAGVAAGVYESVPAACRKLVKASDPQPPIAENHDKYEPFYQLYCKLYPALKDSFKELAGC